MGEPRGTNWYDKRNEINPLRVPVRIMSVVELVSWHAMVEDEPNREQFSLSLKSQTSLMDNALNNICPSVDSKMGAV